MVDIHKQKVVIIGHGSTSRLGIIRAVASMGCEISVIVMTWYRHGNKSIDTRKPYDCYSKYVSHVYYCFAKDDQGLIKILLDKCIDSKQKVILFPDSDFTAATIDDNQDVLSSFFVFPHIGKGYGSIRHWMSKDLQKELAEDIGLYVSRAQIIELRDGAFRIPQEIRYPCFTKALVTINGGKQLFKCCENEKELQSHLAETAKAYPNLRVFVEDYKRIDTEYAVLGFSDGKEVMIPGVIQFLRNTNSHFGIAMTGTIDPPNKYEYLLNQFREFVLRIGFIGVFDIDFYLSDGNYYFGEINLRFGGSGYAVTRMGVNLPAMLIRYLRSEDYHYLNGAIESSASYVNERMCEDDWYRGYISSEEYRKIVDSADISFVKDKKDPRPYRIFKIIHFARSLKLAMRRLSH